MIRELQNVGARFARLRRSTADWHRAVERARDLLEATGQRLQPWMLWTGWCQHVGCDECFDRGPAAPCWGRQACHGYDAGCGCITCATRQARAIAAAEMEGR